MNEPNNDPTNGKLFKFSERGSNIDQLSKPNPTKSNSIEIPSISLPKGGGALKGIDEKFKVNAANGTASFSIPLPISSGRNNFSPSLSLSYNSGNGNSPFGLGWSLDLPGIQRKTDRQIPVYRAGSDEDIFMFSGAEDLVPFLEKENEHWIEKSYPDNGAAGYSIKRYRPRIEGGFDRIEKIYHPDHGYYWKVTSRDNIATLFGRSPQARIADPQDASRVFQWMPEFSYDDKGNWIQYIYQEEDRKNVPDHVFEKNRKAGIAPFTNLYLKNVRYGNRNPYYADAALSYDPQAPVDSTHFFELVFDYGEHRAEGDFNKLEIPTYNKQQDWPYRPDAFSSYRSGFEIRTNRRCFGILMFHHFNGEKQFAGTAEEEDFGENYLVKSLEFEFEASSVNNSGLTEITYLKSILQSGYIRKPGGAYAKKSLPSLVFDYEKLNWNTTVKTVDPDQIVNAPAGLTNNYQWVDLYGEGISGILSEQGEGWYYKHNLGVDANTGTIAFTPARKVIPKPSFTGLSNGILSIQDVEAKGEKQVVVHGNGVRGFFELTEENRWKPFVPFRDVANVNMQDPNTRMIDLNGDGQPDIVVTEENIFFWYACNGKTGYYPSQRKNKSFDEEKGPSIVFADQEQTIFLADMSGDGLTDIVRIRNGEICYWANKGYGTFSAKITMGNAPLFDSEALFNPQYLHLADISGTGATDIIYLGKNKLKAFINLSGNAWSNAHEIDPFLKVDSNSRLSVVDLLGTGTSCIVWSSDLPDHAGSPMRYIDLMNSKKPHVLIRHINNFGKETNIEYKSSTHYYLKDKSAGKPWITKLPFPVQVVSKLIMEEKVTNVRFINEYRYHHGYYDHAEREFRGFGMVEQIDAEHYAEWHRNNMDNQLEKSELLFQKPVLTKTWFHTGAFIDRDNILNHFQKEYWYALYNGRFPDAPLPVAEPALPDAYFGDDVQALIGDEYREALRACKGITLRQEIFALDAPETPTEEEQKMQMKPFTVAVKNCRIQLLQPRRMNAFGVFLVTECESLDIVYERNETDARMAHSLNTVIDELGNVLENTTVNYGRPAARADPAFLALETSVTDFSEDVLNNDATEKSRLQNGFTANIEKTKQDQKVQRMVHTLNSFAQYNDGIDDFDDIDLPHAYRLRIPYETKTFELTGFSKADAVFSLTELEDVLAQSAPIGNHETPGAGKTNRLIEHLKTRYFDDNLNALDFGFYASLGLTCESYQLAFTPALVQAVFSKQDLTELQVDGVNVSDLIEADGRFFNINGDLWIRSGITHFKTSPGEPIPNVQERFFSPVAYEDPYGAITSVIYDIETFTGNNRNNNGYYLFIRSITDQVDNKMLIDIFNYRTMSPARMMDINANPSSVLLDELGLVKALALEGNGVFTDANRDSVNIIQPADSLADLKEYPEPAEVTELAQFYGASTFDRTDTVQLRQAGNQLLQHASIRYVYDFDTYQNTGNQPVVVASISRAEHFSVNNNSAIQLQFEYTDGMGNVAMSKVQAEPGLAYYMEDGQRKEKDTGADLRWVGTGRTVLNNKGNPVKQYEPYFSTNFLYEDAPDLVEIGITPVLYYDALGRQVKTVYADGTLSKVTFDPWQQVIFDQNDTVSEPECVWFLRRTDPLHPEFINDPKEHRAAAEALKHADSPTFIFMDTLGRPVTSLTNNGPDGAGKSKFYSTHVAIDIEGNARAITDARQNTVMEYRYDMLGHRLYQNSMDAGERWVLNNLMENPIYRWDSRDHVFTHIYDAIQRPVNIRVTGGDTGNALDNIYTAKIYGENQVNDYQNNLRGAVTKEYDTAGLLSFLQYDFKGNLRVTRRDLNQDYENTPHWTSNNINHPSFDPDLLNFETETVFDALNRVINTISPDGSETRAVFNEAGLLDQILVTPTDAGEKVFIRNIDYDAKGQRTRLVYGDISGNILATTSYTYEPQTFRLSHLTSRKANGDLLQDLRYTYDPIGNIVEVQDLAQPRNFFNNFEVLPRGRYQYDALYRLETAEGREHAGQAINFNQCDNWKDLPYLKKHAPGDVMAWRNYTQNYQYDPVGNILEMQHQAVGSNWSRSYHYASQNNRLLETRVGGQPYAYSYHPQHGFITALPHLSVMAWNFKDELQATARQQVCNDNNPPETTFYVYDGNGQRVRKVTRNFGGTTKKEERLYLGNFEIYKKHSGNNSGLERTTLHVMDDIRRIAMIDTRTSGNDNNDVKTVRFQLGNHLGSACLEMDDFGAVISYEEFHPYGTTAYQATNDDIKTAAKRYRYTAMERDEESGLEYHSARYYMVWMGRWLNCDQEYLRDGVNIYAYGKNNPVRFIDNAGSHVTDSASGLIGSRDQFLTGRGATGRYLFTQGGGWLDRSHTSNLYVLDVLRDLSTGRTSNLRLNGLDMSYTLPSQIQNQADIENAAVSISYDFLKRYERHQNTRWRDRMAETPFSYEDLTSNRVGIEIGLRLYRRARAEGLNALDRQFTSTQRGAELLNEVRREVIDELSPDRTGNLGRRLYYDYISQYRLVTRGEWLGQGAFFARFRDYSPFLTVPKNYTVVPYRDSVLSPVDRSLTPQYLQREPANPSQLGITERRQQQRPPQARRYQMQMDGTMYDSETNRTWVIHARP